MEATDTLLNVRPVFIFVVLFRISMANKSALDEKTEREPVKWWVSSFVSPKAVEPD